MLQPAMNVVRMSSINFPDLMQIQEFSWEHIGNSDTLRFQPISTEIHSSLEWTRDEALQCRSVTSTATEFFDSGWTVAKLSSLGVHLYFFFPHAEGYLRGRLVLWTGFKEKLPPFVFWLCPPAFDKFGGMLLDELYLRVKAKMGSKIFSGTSQRVLVTDGAGWDCHQHEAAMFLLKIGYKRSKHCMEHFV